MNSKEKAVYFLQELLGIGVTGVLCFCIYHWGTGHKKACFAITLGAIAYLLLCFYNAFFKNKYKGMVEKVLSGLMVIAFSNELYDYNKVIALFPIFKSTDPMLFSLIVLGVILSLLIIIKIMTFIYDNTDVNGIQSSGDNSICAGGNITGGNQTGGGTSAPKSKDNNAWMVLYFVFLIILIGAGGALFSILYNKGILKQSYDFFEVVSYLLKYAGSIVMIFLAIVIVIILLIEMIKLIISRMKVFATSLKHNTQENTVPLYLFSIIVDVVVCYLTYKFTGIDMDSFYDFVNDGKYLALPLMILFVGVAFVIFLRLTHATLVLLVDMKPENVKSFLQKVNAKAKITERVVEIIKMIIDIVLDTLLTALKFVSFIPDFFCTLYTFVLEDEQDFEFVDNETEDSSEEECRNESQ